MSPRSVTFAVICGLSGLVFGIVEHAIVPYMLGGLVFGLIFSTCMQIACDPK